MPRRWLACVAALSIDVSLTSFSPAKPPDLPKYERITVVAPGEAVTSDGQPLPLPEGSTRSEDATLFVGSALLIHDRLVVEVPTEPELASPPLLTGLTMMGVQPIQVLATAPEMVRIFGDCGQQACEAEEDGRQPEPIRVMPEEDEDEQGSVCPYMRQQMATRPARVCIDPVATRTVMENLAQLEKAAQEMAEARRLVREGRMEEAAECLEKVHQLCPCSSYDKALDDLIEEVRCEQQQDKSEPAADPEVQPDGCCCCPLGGMGQFGLCWLSQMFGWLDPKPLPGFSGSPSMVLSLHLSVHVENVPLRTILQNLRSCCGLGAGGLGCGLASALGVSVDYDSLREAGVDLDTPMSLHAENVPLGQMLALFLKPLHLGITMRHGVPTVVAEGDCRVESKPAEAEQPKTCGGSACPKCEELHARHAGKEEMVRGLMKACYLAFEEGRHDKALDLARQAHAIDPARVEADPLVYKLHLLAEQVNKAEHVPAYSGAEEQEDNNAAGASLVPHLPGAHPGTAEAMDGVLTGADGLGVKGKKPAKK
jgi:hypothetical protein